MMSRRYRIATLFLATALAVPAIAGDVDLQSLFPADASLRLAQDRDR